MAIGFTAPLRTLPIFRYHPDPLSTGSIKRSSNACECCGEATGYVYAASFYSTQNISFLCPWCIHSGRAAETFNGSFSDERPLIDAGIDPEIIMEVCKQTPGFATWQQEVWLTHCRDACEFHGDARRADLLVLEGAALQGLLNNYGLSTRHWADILIPMNRVDIPVSINSSVGIAAKSHTAWTMPRR